jgi:hypothetical protein
VWKFFLFSPIKFLSFPPNFSETSPFSSVFLFLLCCSLLKSCSHQKRPHKPLKNNNNTETAAETEQSLASSERERERRGVIDREGIKRNIIFIIKNQNRKTFNEYDNE